MTLASRGDIAPYLYPCGRTCDYTVGGLLMWRDFFDIHYCIKDGALLTSLRARDGARYYNIPLAEDLEGALTAFLEERKAEPLAFCTVPEEALAIIRRHRPDAIALPEEEYFDYLYKTEELAAFTGKKYAGQRNMVRQFTRDNPLWEYRPIGKDDTPSLSDFLRRFSPGESDFAREEHEKTAEVLENLGTYGFFGGVLTVGGRVVGFSLGERLFDTVYLHIEKADRTVKGAYQMLVNRFAAEMAGDAVYINREEDMGNQGLRTSKLSYHPTAILKKYTVTVPPRRA